MGKSKFKNIRLLIALALTVVCALGLFAACNGSLSPEPTLPGANLPLPGIDIVVPFPDDSVSTGDTRTSHSGLYKDADTLFNCDKNITFEVESLDILTTSNIYDYVRVTDKNGEDVPLAVEGYFAVFTLYKRDGSYTPGETYKIYIVDGKEENVSFVGYDMVKEITFSIYKETTIVWELKQNIVNLIRDKDFRDEENGIFVSDPTIGPGSVLYLDRGDVTANEYVIVTGYEGGDGEAFLTVEPATLAEVFEKLEIYQNESFDCSQLDLSGIDTEGIIAEIRESDMFYRFVTAIEAANEAMGAGLPKLKNFEIRFVPSIVDKDIVIDMVIAYKDTYTEGDKTGKLYVELAYKGVISYDIKANISNVNISGLDYDVALTVNTDHKISLAVQWLDAEDDFIIASEEELKAKIEDVLADKTVIPSKLLGASKALGKTFEVPLCEDFTWVIPNTPVSVNLGFKWLIGFEVQGEIFSQINVTSVDTFGIRNKADGGMDFYHTKAKETSNSTMLFGSATLETGVRADVYFSIVGMAKNIRLGIKGDAGVYVKISGITASTALSSDNIGVWAGEFGFLLGYNAYAKIFIVSPSISSGEAKFKLFEFGTPKIYTAFAQKSAQINLATPEDIANIDGASNFYDIDTFMVNAFAMGSTKFERNDFNFTFAGGNIVYFGGNFFLATMQHRFTETLTITLKSDPSISKVIEIVYDDGYVEPAPAPEVPEQPEIEQPEEPAQPEEPVIVNEKAMIVLTDEGKATSSFVAEYGASYTLPALSKLGYNFIGWETESGQVVSGAFTMPVNSSDAIFLSAKWAKAYPEYTYVKTAADFAEKNADGLYEIKADGKYYLLSDINLGNNEWKPIEEFTGVILGNGFTISNFKISGDIGKDYINDLGFVSENRGVIENVKFSGVNFTFTYNKDDLNLGIVAGVNLGTIKNVTVNGTIFVTMKGQGITAPITKYIGNVGGVVGVNKANIEGAVNNASVSVKTNNINIEVYAGGVAAVNEGSIKESSSSKTVTADITNSASPRKSYEGGLVALNKGTIYKSFATVSGVMDGSYVGGLVAYNEGYIKNSYAKGSLNTASTAGGLVGYNALSISNSYSTVKMTGGNDIGGLVGRNSGSISYSYADSQVTGGENVGGLVGYNEKNGTLTKCFVTGSVTGTSKTTLIFDKKYAGGLIGLSKASESNIKDCYRSSAQAISCASAETTVGTVINASTASTTSFFTNTLGFSTSVWSITAGKLPTLL